MPTFYNCWLDKAFGSLGELDKAQALYERAIAFAEAGHYVQVKAKALTGLATLRRQRGDYAGAGAIALHTQAIDLCEALGAKCDLAEAYFQLGLSARFDRRIEQANCFKQAIALFSAIRAPQQVERVRRDSA